jgi:hypothetical protein
MKDPAFLFYYRDFKSSTEGMTNCQRGAYIQLMCIQAENGHITEKDMKKICSIICFDTMQVTLDIDTYNVIKSKFSETFAGSGLFINSRLASEIEKRVKYSESRRNNRKKENEKTYDTTYDNRYDQTYEKHMVNRNINENINEIEIEKGVQGEKQISEKFGPQTPKFSDPLEAGITIPDMNEPDWLAFTKNSGMKIPDMIPAFNSYRLKCLADGIFRDRSMHKAAFQKYCDTWVRNDKNKPTTAKIQTTTETKEKLSMLRQMYS